MAKYNTRKKSLFTTKTIGMNTLEIIFNQGLEEKNAAELRSSLSEIINNSKYKSIYMNFSNVPYIDATAVGILAGRSREAQVKGVSIAVSKHSEGSKRIFKISELYSLFPDVQENNR